MPGSFSYCIFADYSTFTLRGKYPTKLAESIKEKYWLISDYMSKNRLILNSEKTHLLIMTSARNHRSHGNYGITLDTGTEVIEPGTEEKLLGGLISNDLRWNSHVRDNKRSLINILTSRVNALQKISMYTSFKTRKMVANGVVLSHLTYFIQLYGGCSGELISALQLLQNKAARAVTKLDRYTPVSKLLLQCGWMSVRQMISYHSLLLLYKTKQTKKPGYIFSKISSKFPRRTRLATTEGIKDSRHFKSSLAQASFIPRTIKA